MEAETTVKEFKSPKHKLLRLFSRGRQKWRARAEQHHQALRAARITVRDLRKSREEWKRRYEQERQRRLELEGRLAERAEPVLKVYP
jgi:hypothetical protein